MYNVQLGNVVIWMELCFKNTKWHRSELVMHNNLEFHLCIAIWDWTKQTNYQAVLLFKIHNFIFMGCVPTTESRSAFNKRMNTEHSSMALNSCTWSRESQESQWQTKYSHWAWSHFVDCDEKASQPIK